MKDENNSLHEYEKSDYFEHVSVTNSLQKSD